MVSTSAAAIRARVGPTSPKPPIFLFHWLRAGEADLPPPSNSIMVSTSAAAIRATMGRHLQSHPFCDPADSATNRDLQKPSVRWGISHCPSKRSAGGKPREPLPAPQRQPEQLHSV